MLLSKIMEGIAFDAPDFQDAEISDIVYNSKLAGEGRLFAALPGAFSDGHDYIPQAYLAGCRVFLAQRRVPAGPDARFLITPDTRAALAVISANFFSHPERELTVVGVTGTKGKTSVTGMLGACLNAAGIPCGTIGTVGATYNGNIYPTVNTTPESYECMRLFRDMLNAGNRAVVMEVSSLGLKSHRVDGIPFAVGVFTNFSPDHIGGAEHQDLEEYAYWKRQLFVRCENAVLNADDPFSESLRPLVRGRTLDYSLEKKADLTAEDIRPLRAKGCFGTSFTLNANGQKKQARIAVPGLYSVYNALACAAVCRLLGVDDEALLAGLAAAKVPGRCDCLELDADFDVVIDYAHNGQSFHSVLDTFCEYEHNRIITVFGSVGDRAFLRREELGLISGKRADLSVITADDPGYEDPLKICNEIAGFVKQAGGAYQVIPDRAEAVRYALSAAKKGDIVLLLGKGHETAQKVCGEKVPYSDYETVYEYFHQN